MALKDWRCSEVSDSCEYNEHHKCTGRMHEGRKTEHSCWCTCHGFEL